MAGGQQFFQIHQSEIVRAEVKDAASLHDLANQIVICRELARAKSQANPTRGKS